MKSVTITLPLDDARELFEALTTAMNCMAETRMLCIDRADHAQIGAHRRVLCRFGWRLTHADPWAEEEEWTLLQRCKVALLIFGARLLGEERQHIQTLARRLGKVQRRRAGRAGRRDEEFGDGPEGV